MPEQYVKMRDAAIAKGMSPKAAKRKAAKMYNAKHPNAPVGPGYDKKHPVKTKKGKKKTTKRMAKAKSDFVNIAMGRKKY